MSDEITKEQFDKLQSDLTASIEASKGFQESITKLEDNNKALLSEKAAAKKAAQESQEEAAKKSGDVEALEKSWSDKLNTETGSRDEKLSAYEKQISDMTAGAAARKMAAELALPGSADVLLPHIKGRLSVDMDGDSPLVRVLDKDGKPSAMSIDDLRKEIEANKAFAPLLLGSMASGSGDAGKKPSNTTSKTATREEFDAMDHKSRSEFAKEGGVVH